ncbi:hypothetical protein H5399_14055 [Tessaracoccus sp. MC1627]|uniref:hypothetical protein n=1 Tax=Tessaracoccus sp. MC1627 TaxID=2760312 RepID=UPI0016006443|nr:hypothetical protein [Tessaracoccus sp. MC1627]MBB1513718.1 hypothetical protein [Tessaracoccus sp. MC1627]
MSVAVIAVLFVLILAVGLLVVVAASAGHLEVKEPKLGRVIDEANRHLNGTGEVPKFLERLDNRVG